MDTKLNTESKKCKNTKNKNLKFFFYYKVISMSMFISIVQV